ncbi:MAG: HEPN domain-containing protein [Candidatus Izemoplasmatales bacterium]
MTKKDYIHYRLDRAYEALEDAKLLAENERWNTAMNRLYYASFYAVIALLIKNGIETQTHDGVRTQFGLQFVKTGIIDKKFGKLFSKLFDYRLKGDYGDLFDFNKDIVEPLFEDVELMINTIKAEIL